jgi:hypothetical protein
MGTMTLKSVRIQFFRKDTQRMTQNKMVQPDTRRHQEDNEKLTTNQKGKTV